MSTLPRPIADITLPLSSRGTRSAIRAELEGKNSAPARPAPRRMRRTWVNVLASIRLYREITDINIATSSVLDLPYLSAIIPQGMVRTVLKTDSKRRISPHSMFVSPTS